MVRFAKLFPLMEVSNVYKAVFLPKKKNQFTIVHINYIKYLNLVFAN